MSGDDRFSAMHTSAIFKQSKKDNFKVKVDDRFKTLLSDERFQSAPGKVDKYGRKIKNKDSVKKVAEEMKEFYDIETEEVEDKQEKSKQPKAKPGPSGQSMDSRLDYLNKLARGEVSDEDSSSSGSEDSGSESESDEEDSEEDETEHAAGKSTKSALDIPDQPEPEFATDISSTRIAIQNCDWENVSAEDIMVVLQSFCPSGSAGSVRKVTVYVSDFGKKRMEIESKYGPKGIWKEQEREEEEDENNEDLYDYIAAVDEDGNAIEEEEEEESEGEDSESADSASNSEESDSEASESVDEDSESEKIQSKNKKAAPQSKKALKGADFVRRGGAVGLVMHDDLKSRGISSKYRSQSDDEEEEEDSSESEGDEEESDEDEEGNHNGNSNGENKKKAAKPLKDGEGFDEVALRKYELSKLRYYFAVAECDSVRTANMLYEELDGVEMESTSMVFDLSLVPGDLSFADREIRDTYSLSASGVVNPNYKPPDFVVNALQHTKVQCSWDEGEKLRERQLSNFSSWRNLNESELQQYVANSSDSDNDSENNDDSVVNNSKQHKNSNENKKLSKKKQDKAALMRKMLLGDDASQGSDDNDNDDFFENNEEKERNSDSEEEEDSMYGSDGEIPAGFSDMDEDDENEGEGKTLTYMPELGKDLLAKKRNNTTETPYEIEQRKMAERKKARKVAKKEYQEKLENEKKLAVSNAAKKGKKNNTTNSNENLNETEEELKKRAELELLFDDNIKDDYDMRQIVINEKEKLRGKKSKRRKGNNTDATTSNDEFKLDMNDTRFSKLFEGDSRYGIDKTSNEFRLTTATKDILTEQVKRRNRNEKKGLNPTTSSVRTMKDNEKTENPPVDVNNLVNKLKRKYNKA